MENICTIAQQILKNKTDNVDRLILATELFKEEDQDWDNGISTFTFDDGSSLAFDFHDVELL